MNSVWTHSHRSSFHSSGSGKLKLTRVEAHVKKSDHNSSQHVCMTLLLICAMVNLPEHDCQSTCLCPSHETHDTLGFLHHGLHLQGMQGQGMAKPSGGHIHHGMRVWRVPYELPGLRLHP